MIMEAGNILSGTKGRQLCGVFAGVVLSLVWLGSSPVQAMLTAGGGMVYDDDLDITIVQDLGLATTNTFGVSGIDGSGYMDWSTANAWIAAMNSANYLGYSDWRLPHSSENFGYNNSTAPDEMGHLYYSELSGTAAGALGTAGPFTGIYNAFWSDHIASWNTGTSYWFSFGGPYWTPGYQTAAWQTTTGQYSAFAVRDGNGILAVPEPSRVLLLGLGLLGFLMRRKR